MGLSFLGSCYLIYKISGKIFPENKIFNTVFFAFNPLIIIECLVSAHNDIPDGFFYIVVNLFIFAKEKTWCLD